MQTVKNYLSLIKFSHTIFAMPFAMIGFCLGLNSSWPGGAWWGPIPPPAVEQSLKIMNSVPLKLGLVVMCMILARSAAMAFNRYLDRHFDAKNPRTAIREIPSGIISANSALIFTIACSLLFIV